MAYLASSNFRAPAHVPAGPSFAPTNLPFQYHKGGAGGVLGLQPNPIRNISIAFGSAWNAEAPLWMDITRMGVTS